MQAVDVPFEIHMICDAKFQTKRCLMSVQWPRATKTMLACERWSVQITVAALTHSQPNELSTNTHSSKGRAQLQLFGCFISLASSALIWIQFMAHECVELIAAIGDGQRQRAMPVTVHVAYYVHFVSHAFTSWHRISRAGTSGTTTYWKIINKYSAERRFWWLLRAAPVSHKSFVVVRSMKRSIYKPIDDQ